MEASLKTFPTDLPLVLQQCNDLTHLQEVLLARSLEQQQENSERLVDESRSSREECEELLKQLQKERLSHAQTRALLSEEREKVVLVETEVRVLRKQLDREKAAFEHGFGLLKNQALADSSMAESLLAKCTALETLCAKKDEEFACQNEELKALCGKMEQLQLAHKLEVQELNIRLQQEMYMASNLGSAATSRINERTAKTGTRAKRKQK